MRKRIEVIISNKKTLYIGLSVLTIVIIVVLFFKPRDMDVYVISNSWNRSITIQSYEWVNDSSWYYAPSEAREISFRYEIHHFNEVIDHYETKYEI